MKWVYFLRYENQVKIGCSVAPQRRFYEIQSGCPVRIHFLGAMPGSKQLERELHDRFASERLRNEWFGASPELLSFIEANALPTPPFRQPLRRVPRRDHDPEHWAGPPAGVCPYERLVYKISGAGSEGLPWPEFDS